MTGLEFILLISIGVGYAAGQVEAIEFNTKEACENAIEMIREADSHDISGPLNRAPMMCIPKGGVK